MLRRITILAALSILVAAAGAELAARADERRFSEFTASFSYGSQPIASWAIPCEYPTQDVGCDLIEHMAREPGDSSRFHPCHHDLLPDRRVIIAGELRGNPLVLVVDDCDTGSWEGALALLLDEAPERVKPLLVVRDLPLELALPSPVRRALEP